jgi:pSer/pThr/pTyr-binding forkhead associated (FHA) protein
VSLEWTLLVLRLVAAAVLYSFLCIALYVIWRDLGNTARAEAKSSQEQVPSVSDVFVPRGRLQAISSGETELQVDDVFELETHATLGRAPDNYIVLPDTYVSSYHARLDLRDGEWWLTDMDSRNGTLLNGVPIAKSVPLADGDVIGVGQVELGFSIED